MARGKKSIEKTIENIPVAVTEEVVTDIEESPVKEVVYTFQALGYVFILGAIAAAVCWFIYLAQWVNKVYNNKDVYNTAAGTSASKTYTSGERQHMFSFDLTTLCFQGLVASCLLYFVFRHHYNHH